MDIYLNEVTNKKAGFTFPSLPEKIQVKAGARYQSYEIIGKGSVKIPKGTEVGTISWTGQFYGKAKRNEAMIRSWLKPSECKKSLNAWMEKGTVLRLLVTGTNINYDVTIANFEYEEYGAYGNAEYSITFSMSKTLRTYTTAELKNKESSKKTVVRPSPALPKTYTIVSGDNLWKIARKFYGGSGADWKKIYDANIKAIEAAAQKHGKGSSNHGHWIYPGIVLSIP